MIKKPRVLILEDNPTDAELEIRELRQAGLEFEVKCVDTREAFLAALNDYKPEIIISDYGLPQFNGLEALRLLKEFDFEMPFILCTGSLTEEVAVACMKEGAADYILKTSLKRLPSAVTNALEKSESRRAKEKAIAALRQSEEKFRSIIETTGDWIWAIDLEGNSTYNNPAIETILGYTPEELDGKNFLPLMHEEDGEEIKKMLPQFIAEKCGWTNLVCRWHHKDGSIRYLESSSVPVFDEGGEMIGFRGADHDITKRKLIEEELKANEARLAEAQRIAQIGSWEWNVIEDKVFWSEELYRIFGFGPREFGGTYQAYFNCVHPDDQEIVTHTIERALSEKKFVPFDHRIIRPDGEIRFVYATGNITLDEAGNPVKMTGIAQDITERRKSEQLQAFRARETALRAEIGSTFAESEKPLKTNLTRFAEAIVKHLDAAFARIWIFNEAENVLELEASAGIYTHTDGAHARVPVGAFKIGLIAQECKPHITNDVLNDPRVGDKEWARENGMVSFAGYPLMIDGRLVGVAAMFARHELVEEILDAMANAAEIISQTIERKHAENALRESEYKLRTLLGSMSEGLLQVDGDDSVQFVNERFCEMVGYPQDELIGKTWSQLLLNKDGRKLIRKVNERRYKGISDRYELELRRKSGETIWTLVGGVPLYNLENVIVGSMGVFTDITERKRAEDQLLHDAFHDGLTGLANRALFLDHLQCAIERGKSRHSNAYAVLFLDFDRFKIVNDSLGHAEGDKLLKSIARRLESSVRTGDLVARLGGDEFVILLSELVDTNEALLVAERIQNNLKAAFEIGGREIFTSASVGVALSASGHKKAEDMLRDADIAMYHAKANGKAQYQIFDREMHERASKQLQLETEMRHALERGQFEVHYQPIINLETESLEGFESLIRWRHPERGMIPPFEFIPAAEENNLILPLGSWILRESCRQMREWQNKFPPASNLSVSVNLSCKEFLQHDLAERIAETLRETGLDPRCLKLEITESHVMENSEMAVRILDRLRSLGARLSLDDFGTGYSSLSYLHRLPVSFLKIDRSFVMRMTESKENEEIVGTIIKLAQSLKMKTIAEGVETNEQIARLKYLSCEYGQGYFFSKPLKATAAAEFLKDFMLSPAPMRENLPDNLNLIG